VKWLYKPNFGLIWFLAWPPGGQNWKHVKCYNSWTNGWIISKSLSQVHLEKIHDIIPGFLIWPTFQGHRGQSSSGSISRVSSVTTGAIDLRLCTYVPLGHLIIGTSNKDMTLNLGFWFDLLLKVALVKVQNGTVSRHFSLLFDLEHSNLVWISAKCQQLRCCKPCFRFSQWGTQVLKGK
jgi:hypothetical protein